MATDRNGRPTSGGARPTGRPVYARTPGDGRPTVSERTELTQAFGREARAVQRTLTTAAAAAPTLTAATPTPTSGGSTSTAAYPTILLGLADDLSWLTVNGGAADSQGGASPQFTIDATVGLGSNLVLATDPATGALSVRALVAADIPNIFAAVQAPASVTYDHADYSGTTEQITWRAKNTTGPASGAILYYGWETSTDSGATWSTEVFAQDTYQGAGITTGTQRARARAYSLTKSGVSPTPSAWISSVDATYAAAPSGGGSSGGFVYNDWYAFLNFR